MLGQMPILGEAPAVMGWWTGPGAQRPCPKVAGVGPGAQPQW